MLRESSNCRLIRVVPTWLEDVISVTPAIVPSRRSSGVATLVAIVSGLAPGSCALTEIVGKSTCGSGETGSTKNPAIPASATPIVSSTVPIGRLTKGCERFIALPPPRSRERIGPPSRRVLRGRQRLRIPTRLREPLPETIEREIDHRRREQRQQLADDEAAEDREAERTTQLVAFAPAEHQRQRREERGERRHQDRPEAQQRRLVDRLARRLLLESLGVDREVDHHDRVLLDDADQEDDPDDPDHAEVVAGDDEREQRADSRRRQRREDRQ